MKYVIILLTILVLLFNVTGVEAKRNCHKWQENPVGVPSLYDYLLPELDGQYTPIATAYQDYLEDFNFYFDEFPNTCTIKPEKVQQYTKLLKSQGRHK